MLKKYIVLAVLSVWSWTLSAQDSIPPQVPTGEIEDAQIIIEKDKPLTLPKASRFYRKTEIKEVVDETADVDYSISQPEYNFPGYRYMPEPAEYAGEDQPALFGNYVKVGYGNYGSPLIQGYVRKEQDLNYLGLGLRHESFRTGPVRGRESGFSASALDLHGHLDADWIDIDPAISWAREGYYFYGRDTTGESAGDLVTGRVALENWKIGAKAGQQMGNLSYSVYPVYSRTGMKVKGGELFNAENQFFILGELRYSMDTSLSFGVAANLGWTGYDGGFTQKRNYFSLNPWVSYRASSFNLKAGFELVSATDSASGANQHFYPQIEASVDLTDELTLYGSLDGSLDMMTLNTLSDRNRYLDDSLVFLNQNNKVRFQAGVRTRLFDLLYLDGAFGYTVISNLPMFYHSPSDSARFGVLYDRGKVVRSQLKLGVGYQWENRLTVNYSFTWSGYRMDQVREPWYLPNTRADLLASYRIGEVVTLKANLGLLGGITAPEPVTQEPVRLKPIADLGLGVEASLRPNIGVFADVQNVFSKEYERYLNYPSRGLSFKLGFIYRF